MRNLLATSILTIEQGWIVNPITALEHSLVTNRLRVVLSILLLPLLIALLLVTAPAANRITAQFATATPCATQPQIAPTFDTGNSTSVTYTSTGTSDPCVPTTTPTLSPVPSSTGYSLQPQSAQSNYTFPDSDGFLCDNTLTPINYWPNFENPAGLCFVGQTRHVGATASSTIRDRINLLNGPAGRGSMWSTTRFNVVDGFETSYRLSYSDWNVEAIALVIHDSADGLRKSSDNVDGRVNKRALNVILKVNGGAPDTLYVVSNGTAQNLTAVSGSQTLRDLTRGAVYTVVVRYTPANAHLLTVQISGLVQGVSGIQTYDYSINLNATDLDFARPTTQSTPVRQGAYVGFTAGSGTLGYATIHSWKFDQLPGAPVLPTRSPTGTPQAACANLNPDTPGLYNSSNNAYLLRATRTPITGGFDLGYVWTPTGGITTPHVAPRPNAVALIGDWDGDGIDTPGLFDFRSLGNNTYAPRFRLTNKHYPASGEYDHVINLPNDNYSVYALPVVGDWNGDGIDTIGLAWKAYSSSSQFSYDATEGTWRLFDTNSSSSTYKEVEYGAPGSYYVWWDMRAIPITGDWNGDGIDSIGWYYPKSYPHVEYLATGTPRPGGPVVSDSIFRMTNLDGYPELVIRYGQDGDSGKLLPIIGQWSANSCQHLIGLYSRQYSVWFLRNANSAGSVSIQFDYGPANYAVTSTATAGSSPTYLLQPLAGKYAGPTNTATATHTPTRTFTPTNTATSSNTPTVLPSNAPFTTTIVPSTRNTQNILLLRCKFPDVSVGTATTIPQYDVPHFGTLVSTMYPGAGHYWKYMSDNKISLRTDIDPSWTTLTQNFAQLYNPSSQADVLVQIRSAAQDCLNQYPFNLSSYPSSTDQDKLYITDGTILIFAFNNNFLVPGIGKNACGAGLGGSIVPAPDFFINGQQVHFRTLYLGLCGFDEGFGSGTLSHEMGHLFGLNHSLGHKIDGRYSEGESKWDLMSGGDRSLPGVPTPGVACSTAQPSGGSCVPGGLIADQKLHLDLIPPQQQLILNASVQSTTVIDLKLVNGSASGSNDKLVVIIPGSGGEYYTIEARHKGGLYEEALPSGLLVGQTAVIIHKTRSDLYQIPVRLAQVEDIDYADSTTGVGVHLSCKYEFGENSNDGGAIFTAGEAYWHTRDKFSVEITSTSPTGVELKIITQDSRIPYYGGDC